MTGLLLMCVLSLGAEDDRPAIDPEARAVLDRAVAFLGEGALTPPGRPVLRINYRGTSHRHAVYQAARPDASPPDRRFEVLLFDAAGERSAVRWEDSQADGTQATWLEVMQPDGGYRLNLRSRLRWPSTMEDSAHRRRIHAWRIPHLILRELDRDERIRLDADRTIDGRRHRVAVTDVNGVPVRILFDADSGALAGHEHDADLLDGRQTMRTTFKDYRPHPQLGRFPARLVREIGDRVYMDLEAYYARPSEITEDWFDAPADTRAPRLSAAPPSQETIAPGVTLLRNVGGYNAAVADLGDCLAILDAPEQFGSDALPSTPRPEPVGETLLRRVREVSAKPICWVVPTHHHADHLGAVRTLVREGARVLTTEGNVPLLRRILAGIPGSPAEEGIEVLRGGRVLGEGPGRVLVHAVLGDPHVAETLFFYFPATRAVFEADIADYNQSAKRFLLFVEEKGLDVERIYGAHNSAFTTLAELENDDPWN